MTQPDPNAQAIPQPTLRSIEPTDCEVLLIRHGRSADVVPGSPESYDPPLHEQGVRQAAALAERLRSKRIDAVYSSHLLRAFHTAKPLADQRGLEVQVHRDLEEVRLGDWSKGEFRRRAAAGDPEWLAWSRTGRWDGIPGAEGDAVFRARLAAVIAPLVEAHRGQCIAVVAHGGSIGAYVADLFGIHRSLWLTVENTSVTAVRVGLHGSMVVTANDTHHLYDPVLGQS